MPWYIIFGVGLVREKENLYHQMNICSSLLTEKSGHYNNMTNGYLSVWHKFVPHQDQMTSSNCWYAENFNSLPRKLSNKLKELTTFVGVQNQFSKVEMESVLSYIFRTGSRTLFSSSGGDHHFCLPRTFLIGFPKCGTTLLYKYIEAHPFMAKPREKEGQFWREFVRTKQVEYKELQTLLYLFHFYSASKAIKLHPQRFTVDASASTVFATSLPYIEIEKDSCVVPVLLHTSLPNSKLLIIMRNPIDRLWSDFWYFCSRTEWRSRFGITVPENILPKVSEIFHNLTVSALQEFSNCIDSNFSEVYCVTLAGSISGEEAGCEKVRLGLSVYFIHILRWFSVFPRNQILLIRLEDLVADPTESMNRVWSFLNVPSINKVIKYKQNDNEWITSRKYRAHFIMLEKTRNLLRHFFHSYNFKLAELVDDKRYLWNQ